MQRKPPVPPDKQVIWRPWITVDGRRIYARQFGMKAFPIRVDR
jgi:hypothetical protein